MSTANSLSLLIEKQWEAFLRISSSKDYANRIERQKHLSDLYKQLFQEDPFNRFAIRNQSWKKDFGHVHVSFEAPDFQTQGDSFLESSPLNLHCTLHTDKEDYTLIIPLHRHNMELYLYGILTTSTLPSLLSNIDGCFIARPFNEPTSYKWMIRHEDFLDSLYPEEYEWVNELTNACLLAFEDLNVLHLQQIFFNGKLRYSIGDLELLKAWSYGYIYTSDTHKGKLYDSFSFKDFCSWAKNSEYKYGMNLRIKDLSYGFNPFNCEWIIEKEPTPSWFELKEGEETQVEGILTIENHNLPIDVIKTRKKWGWKDSDYLLPVREKANIQSAYTNQVFTINGEKRTLKEWSNLTYIPLAILISRIHNGWNMDDLLSDSPKETPAKRNK
ncbi:hypothetical protein CVD28_02715 [Bacillus sp. M6-12]|uniref:hypothetical protein n=1 Tax=Bacillus sp. M6-12 TaxID=2054166 RepID=UPI000C761B11|nr:hypothetical protein [Bacillus sp. M6-12]PLS19344.1 hypothetical protein CVD28_02715 [Bacillus sp. M6-12]